MDFYQLLPDTIFEAVTLQGFRPTGVLCPLNSYENRVYEIKLEEHEPIVAKFYRPGRWSVKALSEEHQFIKAQDEVEIPVVKPLGLSHPLPEQNTLGRIEQFYYALYPKFRGREHSDISNEDRRWLGRLLGRFHNVGEHFEAPNRLQLNPETYGEASLEFILEQPFLPTDLKCNLETIIIHALDLVSPYFQGQWKTIAVHGDFHPGNILWNAQGPHLLDFDDMVVAPPVQDIWMLFSGDADEVKKQRDVFFEGYEVFRHFDAQSLILTEPLRTLRMIRHAAWIGKRYEEEAFKRAFPYFKERRYWEEFLLSIKEQIGHLQDI